MDEPRSPDLVVGASRLIVDIVRAVLGTSTGDRPVAVLVDPTAGQWEELAGFAGGAIVVLSEPTEDAVVSSVHRGADAVVDAAELTRCLPEAVHVVRGGGVWLTPAQARAVAQALRRTDPAEGRPRLSTREQQILESISAGHSVKQTAVQLGIAPKTVENLQGRLFRKLEARNRAHAVARAFELGLLAGDDDADAGTSGAHADTDRTDTGP